MRAIRPEASTSTFFIGDRSIMRPPSQTAAPAALWSPPRTETCQPSARAKAIAFGHWRQTFHFRTAAEWTTFFERLGFDVARQDTGDGTPFANVLFVLTRRGGV